MSVNFLTVTELNEYLRMKMDNDPLLGNVFLRGEISNFTNHYKTGHFYFSLKDEGAAVRAVMFRSYASRLNFVPENGMKVILHGRITVYPRNGEYQIYVDDMQPDGVGALWLAYEQLRKKLEAEGLFDPARKRPLPRYPARIGIITSPTGAAVRDMIQILGRRYPAAEVILYPALVQGADAPKSLCAGLRLFATALPVDVILLGRGGGSAEDLFAFNNEELARAVAASPVPVVSAVGHETDFTICDFVADLRAPTPSAAAELAVPDAAELRRALLSTAEEMRAAQRHRIAQARARVSALASSGALRSPKYTVDEKRMALGLAEQRLTHLAEQKMTASRTALSTLCARLGGLNPLDVLARGYAAVFDRDRRPITAAERLSVGDTVHVRFFDKTADATVNGIRESE